MLYIIYFDIKSLIQKIDYYKNNPEKSWTTKIGEHIPGGHSMSKIWAFNQIEKKHSWYRRENCVKKVCESLRENAKFIIDFEKKKMLPLTKKRTKIIYKM